MTDIDDLWQGFCDPPDEARPRVWWHWMDGNVDPAGIRLDLEWLHRVGVRGVQMFNGGMGTPLVVPQAVIHGSPDWREAVRLAAGTANELGLEFAVATSAGWSAAGGPWVEPADAMKKVVWSESVVEGGRRVEQALAAVPNVAGPYQDCPRWGADPAHHRFEQDWLTIAVPADQVATPLVPASVRASDPIEDWACLTDGSLAQSISLPRNPDGVSTAWVEQVFDEPVGVAAVTVGLPGPRGFGAAPAPDAVLEASDDGTNWRVVARVPEIAMAAKAIPVRTVAFAPVTARRFRLVLTAGSAVDALPRLAEGVQLPRILRRMSEFLISEFALYPGGRVHAGELKAGFAAAPDYFELDGDRSSTAIAINPDTVMDLTEFVDASGVLRWNAPPGSWRVLRFGASLTGQANGPAPAEATGLEVDKLNSERVRSYLNTYLGFFDTALASDPSARLDALLSDSIESGAQTFTDGIRERFVELRGYDLVSWLPALAGYVVGDAERSDRFLWDYRRTIAELLATEFYGTVMDEAHARGLVYYAEALEDHRPQLGDDLTMRSHADVPMGAMWVFDAGVDEPDPTYLADVKGASSVSHVYGKAFTGAESMSAFHRPWSYTPRRLKHIADLELALGVTRFCIHTSPHQPTQVPPPGIGLAPFLGQAFIRSEPWADLAGPWIDYLARCSWILNQGVPAVDVAVFIGEEGPVTALFGDEPDRSVPPGFDFDYVDLEGLERRVTVENGDLLAGETRYRVLYLGGASCRMTVRSLRRLAELIDAGATVIGRRPAFSPSLADDDEEHAALCNQLWGPPSRVMETDDLTAGLREIGLLPTMTIDGAALLRIGRRLGDAEVTFLANPLPEPVSARLRAPAAISVVSWDPVTLRRERLPEVDGAFELNLPPLGSAVLVPDAAGDEKGHAPSVEVALDGIWRLSLPSGISAEVPGGPRPWTELESAARGFAGVGTYTTSIDLGETLSAGGAAFLTFGDVGDLAQVRVNGISCGVVWTAPWRVEVTSALRLGSNLVEVQVANAWMNRLIAEAAAPSSELFAPVASVYSPDAPVSPSGLTGPVVLHVLPKQASEH
jgi:alpha-L-rhamnosidase